MIFAHHKGKGEDSALKASCHSSRNSVCVSLTDRHWFGCDLRYKQHIDTLLIELCSSYLGFGLSVHSIQGEKIKEKVKKVDENEVVRLI